MYDVTILTASKFLDPPDIDWYIQQVIDEDNYVKQALEKKGLHVTRTNWDNPDFTWTKTKTILFRTIWDYFDRFDEFTKWLDKVKTQTKLINPYKTICWNMDKHYLHDLQLEGINIPATCFIEKGDPRTLSDLILQSGWNEVIIKPAVSGAGRHTYRLKPGDSVKYESLFHELINSESMLLQEFQHNVITRGEVAFMIMDGKFTHAVLKKAKPGDFRVQDDFGGSVFDYHPSRIEIDFAEKVASFYESHPLYARVDMIWDNNNDICVSELELIEPELWFRKYPDAADLLAEAIVKKVIF